MSLEYGGVEGIDLTEAEATRVVQAVVGEAPLNPKMFAGLRRAMQLETITKMEQLPETDIK
jgi:hypothetical protein